MSTYSGSDTDYSSDQASQSRRGSLAIAFPANVKPENMTEHEKQQLIQALRSQRVNTLTELRRIEKIATSCDLKQFYDPLTTAWAHYVNSNNFLNELRGLTKNYPFSSELLDDGKWRVINDPNSAQSWNYVWLILTKIGNEGLVEKHADQMAKDPSMWGGSVPDHSSVAALSTALAAEWAKAIDHMMRHWPIPPVSYEL